MINEPAAETWDNELEDLFLRVCQIGVFAAYATSRGRALVDRELYLPKSWTEDRDRCRAAKVPDGREFHTKGELAKAMVLRALASPPPMAWVTADSAYGQEGRFRRLLEQSGVGYVLAVPESQFGVGCPRIDWLFSQAPAEAWERISCGNGAKGPPDPPTSRSPTWPEARPPRPRSSTSRSRGSGSEDRH
ncbi:transposase [Kitasatospora aureofaciens]|uniref:transposase n=1 Tax=Kitasatospora aureofaciens TaxID=1894 RepID=UPI0036F49D9D